MPDVLAMYTGSKEAFRERIRNERAVELMQEYNRLADLRRWYIAKEKLAHIYQADNIKSGDEVVYGVKEFPDARVFEDRNYWYPFPTSIENMFSKFKQNPGW